MSARWRDWTAADGRAFSDIVHSHAPYRTTHIYEAAYQRGLFLIRVTERSPDCTGPDTWYGGRVLWDRKCSSLAEAKRETAKFWRSRKRRTAGSERAA